MQVILRERIPKTLTFQRLAEWDRAVLIRDPFNNSRVWLIW